MAWQKLGEDRYLDSGVEDKARDCLKRMVELCSTKGLLLPSVREFITQLQYCLFRRCNEELSQRAGGSFINIMAGFVDFSKVIAGNTPLPQYVFLQKIICDTVALIAEDYGRAFDRKPHPEEVLAAFSSCATGSPEYYFSDGDNTMLAYIAAIDKPI